MTTPPDLVVGSDDSLRKLGSCNHDRVNIGTMFSVADIDAIIMYLVTQVRPWMAKLESRNEEGASSLLRESASKIEVVDGVMTVKSYKVEGKLKEMLTVDSDFLP